MEHGNYYEHVEIIYFNYSKCFKSVTATTLDLFNPLNANLTKWSNTLKQFVGNLATNCLSKFDHFVGLGIKGLNR